jgi:hypothetical protein
MRAPKDASANPTVVATTTNPANLVVVGNTVYFIDGSNFIMQAPITGVTPTTFASFEHFIGLATDGVRLFETRHYGGLGNHVGCTLDIATGVESDCNLLGQSCSCVVAAGSAHVYFAGTSAHWRNVDGTGPWNEVDTAAGSSFMSMAPSDCGLYWSDGGSVYFEQFTSGHPALVATSRGGLGAIAVDSTSVYFADMRASIGKVARP